MTLLVTLANNDHVFLLSDRLLTVVSAHRSRQRSLSTKTGFIWADNARMLYAYTGLAKTDKFETANWIQDSLLKAAASNGGIHQILSGFKDIAGSDFRSRPELNSLSKADRRLQIVFAGFLDDHRMMFVDVSNCTHDSTGDFLAEAKDTFTMYLSTQMEPGKEPFSFVGWDGYRQAVKPQDFSGLVKLLEDHKPPLAIIGKAVEVIREIADRPASNGMIGRDIVASRIEPTVSKPPTSSFWAGSTSPSLHIPGMVNLRSASPQGAIGGITITVTGKTLVDPKTPRNSPCPCRSGKKYKYCHGQQRKRWKS
jgi:hypothetical protein